MWVVTSRSFLAALLPELPRLGSMGAAAAAQLPDGAWPLQDRRSAFLRLLGLLLALDAGYALSAGQQGSGYLLDSFLQILDLRCGALQG